MRQRTNSRGLLWRLIERPGKKFLTHEVAASFSMTAFSWAVGWMSLAHNVYLVRGDYGEVSRGLVAYQLLVPIGFTSLVVLIKVITEGRTALSPRFVTLCVAALIAALLIGPGGVLLEAGLKNALSWGMFAIFHLPLLCLCHLLYLARHFLSGNQAS